MCIWIGRDVDSGASHTTSVGSVASASSATHRLFKVN